MWTVLDWQELFLTKVFFWELINNPPIFQIAITNKILPVRESKWKLHREACQQDNTISDSSSLQYKTRNLQK